MVSILTASKQIGTLKPRIFDIGNDFLPVLGNEAVSSDGGLGRREEKAEIEIKNEEALEEKLKYGSIDDIVAPDIPGLAGLASDFYYNDKTAILNKIMDYIFLPVISRLDAANDNYPMAIIQKPSLISTIHYPKSYSVTRFYGSYYITGDYEPSEQVKATYYSDTKLMDYMQVPRMLYYMLFSDRASYVDVANDNYDRFQFKVPQAKPIEILQIDIGYHTNEKIKSAYEERRAYKPFAHVSQNEFYKPGIEPISHPRNSIETIVHDEPQDYIQVPQPLTKEYVSETTKLEDTVTKHNLEPNNLVYFDSNPVNFTLPSTRNDNIKQKTDISDVVIQAAESSNHEQQKSKRNVEEEPVNDNLPKTDDDASQKEYSNQNMNTKETSDDSNYRDPERRRNDFGWRYKPIKTNYKSILRDLIRKLRKVNVKYNSANPEKQNFYTNDNKADTKSNKKHLIETEITSLKIIRERNDTNQEETSEPISSATRLFYRLNPKVYVASLENRFSEMDNFRDVVVSQTKKHGELPIHQIASYIVQHFESKYGCDVSISVKKTKDGSTILEENSQEKRPGSSPTKIVLAQIILERYSPDKVFHIKNSYKTRNYDGGDPDTVTTVELAGEIMKDEKGRSNAYANAVIDEIGLTQLNKIVKEKGLKNTEFVDYFRGQDNYRGNVTTADEMSNLMLNIVNTKGTGQNASELMLTAAEPGKNREIYFGKYVKTQPKSYGIISPDDMYLEIQMKHGMTERDAGMVYRLKGKRHGIEFDYVVAINFSNLKQRLVKADFKSGTSFGGVFLPDFFGGIEQLNKHVENYLITQSKPIHPLY